VAQWACGCAGRQVSYNMKAEFMTMWDGIVSEAGGSVIVLGAPLPGAPCAVRPQCHGCVPRCRRDEPAVGLGPCDPPAAAAVRPPPGQTVQCPTMSTPFPLASRTLEHPQTPAGRTAARPWPMRAPHVAHRRRVVFPGRAAWVGLGGFGPQASMRRRLLPLASMLWSLEYLG
jgi:hypothetical protein